MNILIPRSTYKGLAEEITYIIYVLFYHIYLYVEVVTPPFLMLMMPNLFSSKYR